MTQHPLYEEYLASIEAQITHSEARVRTARERSSDVASDTSAPWHTVIDQSLEDMLKTTRVSDSLVHPPKNAALDWSPDYALPVFMYAKALGTQPAALATAAAEALQPNTELVRVEATGPYINILLSDTSLIAGIKAIITTGSQFGRVNDNSEKVAIVEYSSPNVAKPFGINHLRSTVIGESIARLFEATGYTVIRDNHLGDWGTQFGNLLAAHNEYAHDRDFASLSMDELTQLYVRFSEEKKSSPRLVKLGQTYFARLEAGDPDLLEKWTIALRRSLEEFSAMYKRLDIQFDTMIGEGYYVASSNLLIDTLPRLVPDGLVVADPHTKAVYINAEHPVVIRTQDGYGVYAARDLATIQFRQQKYGADDVVYVVGDEQSSYFRSIFEVASKAGLTKRGGQPDMALEHIGFGLLLDKDGKKLSTRKGTSGKLEDVVAALDAHAIAETRNRNPDMDASQADDIAHKVAIGALIWNDLRTDRTSSVKFDIEKMLELGGGSVIDVLYAYSRTCSILDKLHIDDNSPAADELPAQFSNEIEHQLAVRLNELTDVIRKAMIARAPHVLVLYLQELSQLHGRFYEESRVVGVNDPQLAQLRIALHRAYKTVVQNALVLLNIPASKRL